MKKTLSLFLAFIIMISATVLAPTSAFSATKTYAEDKLVEIQKQAGFVPGKTAIVTGNCFKFVCEVCKKLYGVTYDNEILYGNFRANHSYTGKYYTVDTYTTTHTSPTSTDVENIISFFTKNAAPGDIMHYGGYTTGTSNGNTHTVMIQSIDNEKMGFYHANYQTVDNGRNTCHIDYIYWDSFRKNPTTNEYTSDGHLKSMNAIFYNKMRSTGLGISINRFTDYESKYYLVGASVPVVKTSRSGSYSVKLTWDEIIGASKYQVQYKLSNADAYTTATSTCTDLLYDVKNLEIGKLYKFRVRAYVGKKWMKWSDEKSVRVLPPIVSTVTFGITSSGINMKWGKRTDITGVRVYRSESENGTFAQVKDITDTSKYSYLDKDIEYDQNYYYKFERYLVVDGKTYKSVSPAKAAKYELEKPTVSYVNTSTTSADFNIKANGVSDSFEYYVTDTNERIIVSSRETEDGDVSVKTLGACKAYRFYAAQKTQVGTGEYTRVAFRALPAKVGGVKASNVQKGVEVSFNAQSDATGYAVYRSTSENGTYTRIANLEPDVSSYTDATVKYGTAYYYKVAAIGTLSGKQYFGEQSNAVSGKHTVGKVANVKAVVRTPASFTVKWDAAKNAQKYTLEYKPDGGKWAVVGSVKGTSKVVTGLKLGTLYYFRVRAADSIGTGAYSKAVSRRPAVPKPETPTAKLVSKGIRVSWANKSYATGYKIFRSTSENGTYSLVKTVSNNTSSSWTDTSVAYGKTYYYKVVCYKVYKKKTYSSSRSNPVKKKYELAVPVLTVEKGENSANLLWKKVEGAEKYVVQYKPYGGAYKSVTVAANTLSVLSLESGTAYYFRVKAVSAKGSSSYCTAQRVQF